MYLVLRVILRFLIKLENGVPDGFAEEAEPVGRMYRIHKGINQISVKKTL